MNTLILLTLLPIQGEMIADDCRTGWRLDRATSSWVINGPCEAALLQEDRGYIAFDMSKKAVIRLVYPLAINRITFGIAHGIGTLSRFSPASYSVDGVTWIDTDAADYEFTGERGHVYLKPATLAKTYQVRAATYDIPSTAVLYVRGIESPILDTEYKTDYIYAHGTATPGQTPVIWFTYPAHREEVFGTFSISVDAYDDGPIKRVIFVFRDPALPPGMNPLWSCRDLTAPYSCDLDVSTLAPGRYRLAATVIDTDRKRATVRITIFVK